MKPFVYNSLCWWTCTAQGETSGIRSERKSWFDGMAKELKKLASFLGHLHFWDVSYHTRSKSTISSFRSMSLRPHVAPFPCHNPLWIVTSGHVVESVPDGPGCFERRADAVIHSRAAGPPRSCTFDSS